MSNDRAQQLESSGGNRPLADATLVACPDCDLLQRIPEVPPGASVRCPRCDKELWRHRVDSFNRTFALTIAALVLYIIANTVPMLGLTAVGREAFTTVVGGAQQLWHDGQQIVAVLVLFAAVISPALQIGFLLLILIGCRRERPPVWVGTLLRHLPMTRTWSMIEVMLLGVLVALTKIADYATVILGTALFALFALVILLAAIQSCFDPREVWERVEWAEEDARRPVAAKSSAEVTA
jgi:paraquat-inducible protein A